MRTVVTLAMLAALGGCAQEPLTMEYRGTLDVQTRGMSMSDDGSAGHAAMWDTTCGFRTRSGMLTGDTDFPGNSEEVQDVSGPATDMNMIVGSYEGLHVLGGNHPYDYDEEVPVTVPHGLEGQFLDNGFVSLTNPADGVCVVEWYTADGVTAQTVDEAWCNQNASLAVNGQTGLVLLGSDSGVAILHPEEDTGIYDDLPGDLVVFDMVLGHFYVASLGGSEVAAIDGNGVVLWATSIEGSITGLSDMGDQSGVMVATEQADGSGTLVQLDGATGAEVWNYDTSTGAVNIEVSESGGVLAVVVRGAVHFYDLLAPLVP